MSKLVLAEVRKDDKGPAPHLCGAALVCRARKQSLRFSMILLAASMAKHMWRINLGVMLRCSSASKQASKQASKHWLIHWLLDVSTHDPDNVKCFTGRCWGLDI